MSHVLRISKKNGGKMRKLLEKISVGVLSIMLTAVTVYGDGEPSVKTSENQTGIYSVTGDVSAVPDILAESAIVVDMKTGYTLLEKNIYDKHYPASITKVMTAILTLEQASLEETVTFSEEAVFSIEPGSSAAYVDVGEQLTVEQCLYGLMLISGNDLANGLAEHVGGSMENFAVMMTDKAKALGCINTNFTNAHGLHDENHYTCAYDMSLIAKYAYENLEMFRTLCSTGYYECPPTNKQEEIRYWRNTNKLINEAQKQYYPDVIGGKTGFTNQAGGTLVTFANINGRMLLGVVMKTTNSAAAYADATVWYEYIRNNITESMYATLDEKYEEELNQTSVQPTEQDTEETTSAASVTDNKNKEKTNTSEGMWIGWKIIILVVTVFIIYYVYVRYMRYKRKKIRMEKRRQQPADREGRYERRPR